MAWRILKSGMVNIFRNAWLSIAAMAVMTVALTIILSAVVLNVTARNAIKELSKNFKITVYLKNNAAEPKKNALLEGLRSGPGVASVTYVDKNEALKRFRAQQKDISFVEQGLALTGADTLPESVEVSLSDLDTKDSITAIAKADSFKEIVEDISVEKNEKATKTIERASALQKFIVKASIVSAVIFAAVSVLIIFNTIRMAIYTRSEEIKIMKLIGATPGYIRGPFLVEAAMYGVIASIVANGTVFAAISSLGSKFSKLNEFSETYEFFTQPLTITVIAASTMCLGMFIGVFSSMLAMEKHLKPKKW